MQLNQAQQLAVYSDAQHLLVLAGAGSGKTKVLTERIAHFIADTGASPWGIFAVTFTNKAAAEMRRRLELRLERSIQGMWLGTFHGLANRLLRQFAKQAGLPENFQVIDSDDQVRLLKRIMRDQGLDEKQLSAKQVSYFINGHKDQGRRAGHLQSARQPEERQLQELYALYEQACQAQGVCDFGELLLRSLELVRDNPEVQQYCHQRFSHLLVDEFQDSNAVQYAWLRLLASPGARVTIVGDDDQSIYGWRGALVENIQSFTRDFVGADMIRLEQNYRSTGLILQAANAVIANNTGRLGKELWTQAAEGNLIRYYQAFNDLDEANYVAEEIRRLGREGTAWSEIAILYRSNTQSRQLEEALLARQVPYRIYGGLRFYERAEIKNVLAYLRLVLNRHDDTAFERVINTPARGLGDKSVQLLRDLAKQYGLSLWQAAQTALQQQLLRGKAQGALQGFIGLIEQMDEQHFNDPLSDQLRILAEQSGLLQMYQLEPGEKGEARVENLQELCNAAQAFSEQLEEGILPAAAFLDQAALDAGDRQADEFSSAVQLMTLHSAKGLEFPYVFLVGMEERLFPHQMALQDGGLEEERRLCYVGITRAMQQLYLTSAESRRLYGEIKACVPSRFLREIPPMTLESVRMGTALTSGLPVKGSGLGSAARKASSSAAFSQPSALGIKLGQLVSHPRFGEGVVLNIEGENENARAEVEFANEGRKVLMLARAKLEAI